MNVNSIIVLIMGIVLLAIVGLVFVSYLKEKKMRDSGQIIYGDNIEKNDEIINSDNKTSKFFDDKKSFIIPEEISDETIESVKEVKKTDYMKMVFTEKKTILVPNEQWNVSISRVENKEAVFNTFYIFTHDFIYGDKKLYVGTTKKKAITLREGGVAEKHGFIFYDQDFGLVYKDLIGSKFAYYKRMKYKAKSIYNTCVKAPFVDNKKAETVDMIKITDGLELFIGAYVLTFIKRDVHNVADYRKELIEDSVENDEDDIKKIIAEADLKRMVNKSKKGISSWFKNNF